MADSCKNEVNRCDWLEAVLCRLISVWHQSIQSRQLSWYFDVIHWSVCPGPLQVEKAWWLSLWMGHWIIGTPDHL